MIQRIFSLSSLSIFQHSFLQKRSSFSLSYSWKPILFYRQRRSLYKSVNPPNTRQIRNSISAINKETRSFKINPPNLKIFSTIKNLINSTRKFFQYLDSTFHFIFFFCKLPLPVCASAFFYDSVQSLFCSGMLSPLKFWSMQLLYAGGCLFLTKQMVRCEEVSAVRKIFLQKPRRKNENWRQRCQIIRVTKYLLSRIQSRS